MFNSVYCAVAIDPGSLAAANVFNPSRMARLAISEVCKSSLVEIALRFSMSCAANLTLIEPRRSRCEYFLGIVVFLSSHQKKRAVEDWDVFRPWFFHGPRHSDGLVTDDEAGARIEIKISHCNFLFHQRCKNSLKSRF